MAKAEKGGIEAQFPKGTKVRLNVGGPTMSVNGHGPTGGYVTCTWFSGKKLERGNFAPETLELVKDEKDEHGQQK